MENKTIRDRRTLRREYRTVTNQVALAGTLTEEFSFCRRGRAVSYYSNTICILRNTGSEFTIPVLVPQTWIPLSVSNQGRFVEIRGQFRSYNYTEGDKARTAMQVFAQQMNPKGRFRSLPCMDQIFLDGFVCKMPSSRINRNNKRVTSVILAVNRSYARTDYIPCVFRDDTAAAAAAFYPGVHLAVWGEIQSRVYEKRPACGEPEYHTVYEVSVQHMEER